MQVLIDGKTIEDTFPGDATIESTLRRVQQHHCPSSRLVVGIRCDDVEVDGEEIAGKLSERTGTIEKLEVLTSTKHDLVIGAMLQASQALQESESACQRIGEQMNEGQATEGVKALGECLSVWQQIHEAVTKSLTMLQLDPESMFVRDEPLIDLITRPRDVLVQVKQALMAQDYVLLADVLQYEFSDVTETWYAVLNAIRQAAEDQRDHPAQQES